MQFHVPKCRNRAAYMRYKCEYTFVVSVKPSVVFKLTKRLYSCTLVLQKKKNSLSSIGFNYDKESKFASFLKSSETCNASTIQ